MTRTALYRHYDKAGTLLYVGITDALAARDKQHLQDASWFKDVSSTSTQWLETREHARALESVAIQHENPIHNVALRSKTEVAVGEWRNPLIDEIEEASAKFGLAPSTIGQRAVTNSRLYKRLLGGGDCSYRVTRDVRKFISNLEATGGSVPQGGAQ